jgi:hypothetical protein
VTGGSDVTTRLLAAWRALILSAAGVAGHAAGLTLRFGPGLTGAALVSVGVGLAYLPAGLVAAGAFLLLLDRKAPD